jgi:hypothetical protein
MLATGNSPSGGPAKRPHFQLTETSSPSDIIDWLKDTLTGAEFQSLCVENVSAKRLLACRDTQVTTALARANGPVATFSVTTKRRRHITYHCLCPPLGQMRTQTGHKFKLSGQFRSY